MDGLKRWTSRSCREPEERTRMVTVDVTALALLLQAPRLVQNFAPANHKRMFQTNSQFALILGSHGVTTFPSTFLLGIIVIQYMTIYYRYLMFFFVVYQLLLAFMSYINPRNEFSTIIIPLRSISIHNPCLFHGKSPNHHNIELVAFMRAGSPILLVIVSHIHPQV